MQNAEWRMENGEWRTENVELCSMFDLLLSEL